MMSKWGIPRWMSTSTSRGIPSIPSTVQENTLASIGHPPLGRRRRRLAAFLPPPADEAGGKLLPQHRQVFRDQVIIGPFVEEDCGPRRDLSIARLQAQQQRQARQGHDDKRASLPGGPGMEPL